MFARPPAGTIPAELGKLAALEYLDLGRNELSGEYHNACLNGRQNACFFVLDHLLTNASASRLESSGARLNW